MNKYERIKGITLIALVITIIVLLILAGIAVAQLSENGLFEKTQLAKERQDNAEVLEQERLAGYENSINEYVNGDRDTIVKGYNKYYNKKEQIIGCWSNGKPIYRINIPVYTYGLTSVGYHYFYSDEVSIENLNIEEIIDFKAINGTVSLRGTITSYEKANNRIGILYYGTDGNTNKISGYTAIVEYTKTTDAVNTFSDELVGTIIE